MIIADKIYGNIEIDEDVKMILEKPYIQRLKKIHQNGADFLIDKRMNATRYEHSVGVMILLKKLGATKEEQIAGLLHDVSHTVFSHMVDTLIKNENQNFHEQERGKFIEINNIKKDIQEIGFNPDNLLNINNFSLLDKKMPGLCADRIDYMLRDLFNMDMLTNEEIKKIIDSLIIEDDIIKIKTIEQGRNIIKKFIDLNKKIFFNPYFEISNVLLSNIIRKLLDNKIIKEEDLFKDDEYIIKKIETSSFNKELININNKIRIIQHPKEGEFKVIRFLRYIDPVLSGSSARISEIDTQSHDILQEYLKTKKEISYNILI